MTTLTKRQLTTYISQHDSQTYYIVSEIQNNMPPIGEDQIKISILSFIEVIKHLNFNNAEQSILAGLAFGKSIDKREPEYKVIITRIR